MKNGLTSVGEFVRLSDKWIWLFCLSLSGISLYFLNGLYIVGVTDNSRGKTQLVAIIAGALIALVLSIFDYRKIVKLWRIYLPACVLLMALTYILGRSRGGNQAWLMINLFGRQTSIQPSEFLKISFITTFSLHLNHVKGKLNSFKNIMFLGLHGGGHILLVLIQRDDGTAIVFTAIFLIMLIIAGLSWKYILIGAGLLAAAAPVVWQFVLNDYQRMRFRVVGNPGLSEDDYFQQLQGLKALGYGGIRGVGFEGVSVTVPESYNDFIFTFIGQVAGLIGCMGVIVLILFIGFRLFYNGNRAADITGRMICMGMLALIMVQTMMNVGMCLSILPVIGIPLPFLSSGGSSVLAIYIGMGFALSTCTHKKVSLFE